MRWARRLAAPVASGQSDTVAFCEANIVTFCSAKRRLGERQNGLYREGEAPADPMPSSAGASLSHPNQMQVEFSLPLDLVGALARSAKGDKANSMTKTYEVLPGQSIELLQELHILTRDGKMNQDSRRKLKQVFHLFQFIEPLLREALEEHPDISLVDHGAGKSYLGFLLYDLFFKEYARQGIIWGIERREDLVTRSRELAKRLGFSGMSFLNRSVDESLHHDSLPERIDVVTALHACDTATDDAIRFALNKRAKHIVVVPCCQAEVASILRKNKNKSLKKSVVSELWRHALHTREFGSQITNVLRCLQLEAHGYLVSVTELVGWEHSMKNELIIASYKNLHGSGAAERLTELLEMVGLEELSDRFR